jgi:Acyl-CoA carboxylase epsilon subunit
MVSPASRPGLEPRSSPRAQTRGMETNRCAAEADEQGAAPWLRVVRGKPTEAELAALLIALLTLGQRAQAAGPDPSPRPAARRPAR